MLAAVFIRLVLGAAALVFGLDGVNLFAAATLVVFAVVADGICLVLSGPGRAALGLRDVVDYLTLIIAPWLLVESMLVGSRSVIQEVLIDLPLVAGAVRCAGGLSGFTGGTGGERRGLSAMFFALVAVAAVFLHLPATTDPARMTVLLSAAGGITSLLMLAPIRYRALPRVLTIAALVVIAVMPFVLSDVVAGAVLIGAAIYIVVGPFGGRQA